MTYLVERVLTSDIILEVDQMLTQTDILSNRNQHTNIVFVGVCFLELVRHQLRKLDLGFQEIYRKVEH